MKTKNNVQKAILRSAAVIVSFILISYTVSAQEFWKRLLTNSSFNEIAIAMADNSGKMKTAIHSDNAESFILSTSVDAEPALNLENWMTDDNYFGQTATGLNLTTDSEEALEIEDWMLDNEFFENTDGNEKPLELENWMIAESVWKNS